MSITTFMLQQAVAGGTAPANPLYSYVTSPYISWFPLTVAVAFALIAVIAFVYMLSSFSGRYDLKVWARSKIFDILLSFVLIFIFLLTASIALKMNFAQIFGTIGLVPTTLCGNSTDLFSLALCDLHTFNGYVLAFNQFTFGVGVLLSFVPGLTLSVSMQLLLLRIPILSVAIGTTIQGPSLIEMYTGFIIDAVYTAFVLVQVQFLLLATSLLLFSVLMALGLISRFFVVTRTFGGAMIAFAVGLGLLYPLMVSMTYGYIDVGINPATCAVSPAALQGQASSIIGFGSVFVTPTSQSTDPCTGAQPFLGSFLSYFGLIATGLVFVPIINFIVVDVFIIDFSQAVGERMDFLSMLTGLV